MVFIGAVIFLVVIAIALLSYLNSCPHSWTIIGRGKITNSRDEIVGFYNKCECAYCHKLKINKVEK